jgi:hypothetical protein
MTNFTKTFHIDRKKWQRGNDPDRTYLWSSGQQKGCCLGHVIHQSTKCSWDELNNLKSPMHYYGKASILTIKTFNGSSDNVLADNAMSINDDRCISDKERERQLIELFNNNGYGLEFYN